MQDLVANGQLKLSKIPTDKNPADVLTKYLTASTLHKLLPKLGVMTRAADSKDLLSMVGFELPACSQECPDSFFIGMMAEEPFTAQLAASRVASRPLHSSLQEHSQEAVPNLPASQRSFSLGNVWRYLFSFVALLCAANLVSLVPHLCHWTVCFYNNIFAKESLGSIVLSSFGKFVANKLAKKKAQRQSQKPRTAFGFVNNSLLYNSFVYPMLGDKVAFNYLADLSGMGSVSLSR